MISMFLFRHSFKNQRIGPFFIALFDKIHSNRNVTMIFFFVLIFYAKSIFGDGHYFIKRLTQTK